MARAEAETTTAADAEPASTSSPDPAVGVPSAASVLVRAATAGVPGRGLAGRALPRLSNGGMQALARAALAREPETAPPPFQVIDDVISALVRESQDEKLYLPKNALAPVLQLPSLDEIVAMVATANSHTRRSIAAVHANPGRNPEDTYWASTKGMAGFRSYMTAGSEGIVNIYPQTGPVAGPKMRTSVEHESGHVVSQKAWGDNDQGPKWAPWREAMKKDAFSTSKYAKTGIADDFAEAWALLMEVEGTEREKELETLMPARYAILKTFL